LGQLRIEQRHYRSSLPKPSDEERRLIEELLSEYTDHQQEALRLILYDSVGQFLYTMGNPRGDTLLRRIYALRANQAVNLALVQNASRVVTRVALVDDLPSTRADAIILRRPDLDPSNIILLRKAEATGEQLVAAVSYLRRLWEERGVAPAEPMRLAVRRNRIATTTTEETEHAQGWIERIRASTPRRVPGLGKVSTAVIPLRAAGVN
jgi:hypothetical protein